MSTGKTNSGTGGGSGKSSIIVTAPTGSVVYVEKQDGKRKNASERNGTWTFKNCDIGTWTAYASLDDQTATKTVVIQEEGQLMRYRVEITYFAATIAVTYPVDSVCTCSNGDTVLTAPDTSGFAVFTVIEPGWWVVSCSDEDKTAEYNVEITTDGQEEEVTLSYETFLINTPLWINPILGTMERKIQSGTIASDTTYNDYRVTWNAGNAIDVSTQKIDISSYKTMEVNAFVSLPNTYGFSFGFAENTLLDLGGFISVVSASGTGEKLLTLDISDLKGEYYLKIAYVSSNASTIGSAGVHYIRLMS